MIDQKLLLIPLNLMLSFPLHLCHLQRLLERLLMLCQASLSYFLDLLLELVSFSPFCFGVPCPALTNRYSLPLHSEGLCWRYKLLHFPPLSDWQYSTISFLTTLLVCGVCPLQNILRTIGVFHFPFSWPVLYSWDHCLFFSFDLL